MNSLKVPESGLLLEGSPGKEYQVPPQAFTLTLSDNVIEGLLASVQNGDAIELALGAKPSLNYGSTSHEISPPDSYPHDLYLTRPFESTRTAGKLPHTSSLFRKPSVFIPPSKANGAGKADRDVDAKSHTSKRSVSPPSDPGVAALQNGLASLEAAKEKARVVEKLPTKKPGVKPKAKLLSGYSPAPRSIPTSPRPSLGSPSSTPTLSASQQAMERAREQRVAFVHELAVQDRSLNYLSKKWTGKEEDMRPTLEKVAHHNQDTDKWTMKMKNWRELDVWSYDYDTQEQRQKAIENATSQYDKQRLSPSEPEWDRLLRKEDRGKGKILSRLQAELAKGPAQPPKIKVQKADGGSDDGDSVNGDKPKSEAMSRSSSNPLPSKTKKTSAQEKRLLGNSKTKAATKVSPTKPKATANTKANGGRVLSQAIIENSDSSGDEGTVVSKPKLAAPPKASKPAIREPIKQPTTTTATKRPREEDDSSSSSGTPLMKRIKPKTKAPAPPPRLKSRPVNTNANSRSNQSSNSVRAKNTSPTKSSPLASSPPTNASDLENESPPLPKKRKIEVEAKSATAKKRATANAFSNELVLKANKFKIVYRKYEQLHKEISGLENPSEQKISTLWDMQARLSSMKKEIYQECPPGGY